MPDQGLISTLQRQLAKYDDAVTEFIAVEAQLKMQENSARVSDMIRINRETISSIQRSAELVRERLSAALQAQSAMADPFSRVAG